MRAAWGQAPICALSCALALGCGPASAPDPAKAKPAATAVEQSARVAPRPTPAPAAPVFEHVPPSTWRSTRKNVPEVAPPPAARESWRALASRTEPIQVKTPSWQTLPPEQSVELAMPEGSAHRCLVTPLSTVAVADDFGVKLQAWVLTRRLLCSSDGFATWTEQGHVLRIAPDGRSEVTSEGRALLRERGADGKARESFVTLRSDPEQRSATTGPPRVLPGVARTDD